MFKYLDVNHSNDLACDSCYQQVTSNQCVETKDKSMKDLYVNAIEEIPPNTPETRGRPIQLNFFVDSDHAGDRITRHYQTGMIFY